MPLDVGDSIATNLNVDGKMATGSKERYTQQGDCGGSGGDHGTRARA